MPQDMSTMSPMDALAWFDPPRSTYVTLGAGITKLCGVEPRRIAIVIASSGSVAVGVDPTLGPTGSGGYPLSTATPPLSMTQADYGNLVQSAWYAASGALGTITVIEVLLREWPGER